MTDYSNCSLDELRNLVEGTNAGVLNANTIFIQIPNSFLRNDVNKNNLNPTEKLLYEVLWGYSLDNRGAYPSHSKLSDHLGIGRKAVLNSLKSLEKKGGILILNRIKKNKAKATNLYYLAEIDNKTGDFVKNSLDILLKIYPDKIVHID